MFAVHSIDALSNEFLRQLTALITVHKYYMYNNKYKYKYKYVMAK